ncbi:unnamed protein product [Phytophthora fragariaefolia]|uniref:Unnamed protein product n=1 Tax=Phytophthora fragariaefolia TaxID=1490495 RepID=A0A9W6TM93_9STRA|nr:unnamed protein product [Phytophthora fragariaefolia]
MISIRHRRLQSVSEARKAAEETKSEEQEAQQEQEDAVETAKRQLQELELKLQGLTDQKHAKFQLLKDILVAEARSKIAGAATAAKKRRVEFKDPSMTPSPAKMQSPVPLSDAGNVPGSAEKAS